VTTRLLGCFSIILFSLTACAAPQRQSVDLRQISYWGLGWSLRGAPNRISSAIPPMVRMLQQDHPKVRSVSPSAEQRQRYGAALNRLRKANRRLVGNRMIGLFTVQNLGCAGRSFPVFDQDKPAAVFFVLDVERIAKPDPKWCDRSQSSPIEFGRFVVDEISRHLVETGKSG